MPLTSLFIHRVEIQRAKSDKRQQVARDGGNDDMRLNSGQRGADRKGRQEEGINPRNSDGEPSSEPSEESQSSQEEVSWIQVSVFTRFGPFSSSPLLANAFCLSRGWQWFCSLQGNEFFTEVAEEFIQDDFNLTGLGSQVCFCAQELQNMWLRAP